MPGTGDDAALQLPLAEGAAAVRTGILNGIEGSIHVEDRDGLAGAFGDYSGAYRYILLFGGLDSSRHKILLSTDFNEDSCRNLWKIAGSLFRWRHRRPSGRC